MIATTILKSGSFYLGKVAQGRVVKRTRFVVMLLAISGLHGQALAQRSVASAILPSDTAGARKNAKPAAMATPFVQDQLSNDRVLLARVEKRFELKRLFRDRGLPYPAEHVFVRIFKRERLLEMWVRTAGQDTFQLLKQYEICALSDKPGPKREQGDLQTPEGFYWIDHLNPASQYHLSLHIDYPNQSDRILGDSGRPLGGDIFIHGGCQTEGCLAVTNDAIKEIYWLAVEARDNGQRRIPVHIFPARLTTEALAQFEKVFAKEPELISFWTNLKPGYDYFEQNKRLPVVTVNKRGRYELEIPEGLLGKPTPPDSSKTPSRPIAVEASKGN